MSMLVYLLPWLTYRNYQKEKKHQKIMLNKVENINFSNRRQKSVLLFSIAIGFALEFKKLSFKFSTTILGRGKK